MLFAKLQKIFTYTNTIYMCSLLHYLKVNILSELFHYPDDVVVTMLFCISYTTKYTEITESYLDKRIAIAINGQKVSTPVVKIRLDNGARSVMLDVTQVAKLFPNVNIEGFKSTNQYILVC